MFNSFFQRFSQDLGIDIGTSSIKVVELSKSRDTYKLENYGAATFFSENEFLPMEVYEQNALKIPDEQVAELLKKVIIATGITAKKAAISLPVFSAFSTIIELPPMPESEHLSNSDPVTGQAGWYDVRVRIYKADPAEEKVTWPQFATLAPVPGEEPRRKNWLAYVAGKIMGT